MIMTNQIFHSGVIWRRSTLSIVAKVQGVQQMEEYGVRYARCKMLNPLVIL